MKKNIEHEMETRGNVRLLSYTVSCGLGIGPHPGIGGILVGNSFCVFCLCICILQGFDFVARNILSGVSGCSGQFSWHGACSLGKTAGNISSRVQWLAVPLASLNGAAAQNHRFSQQSPVCLFLAEPRLRMPDSEALLHRF